MQSNITKKVHLSQGERYQIEILWKNGRGKSCHYIGKELKKDHTVISREIERNGIDRGWMQKKWYSAKIAQEKVEERRRKANFKNSKLIKDPEMLRKFYQVFKDKHKSQGVDEIIGALRLQ